MHTGVSGPSGVSGPDSGLDSGPDTSTHWTGDRSLGRSLGRSLRDFTPESPGSILQQTYFEASNMQQLIRRVSGCIGLSKELISHTPSKEIPLFIVRMS